MRIKYSVARHSPNRFARVYYARLSQPRCERSGFWGAGCVTVHTIANNSKIATSVVTNTPATIPWSLCNGTCSHTTSYAPSKHGFIQIETQNNLTVFNASIKWQIYPLQHRGRPSFKDVSIWPGCLLGYDLLNLGSGK